MKIAIIGAGPSGLTCCKSLLESGHDVTCYEAGEAVGGQWVINNSSGMSSAYDSLRTNTNRDMSRFSDFAFPDDYPEYPSHSEMAQWFAAYAKKFNLLPHIELANPVNRITYDNDQYYVESSRGTETFHSIVVASGNLWCPVYPAYPGTFTGQAIHAQDYQAPNNPCDLKGKKVLVVGLGNSGCEISVELSKLADVTVSARSGQNILPRVKPGQKGPPHPAEAVGQPFKFLPKTLRNKLFQWLMPKILRRMMKNLPDPEALGLPALPKTPFEKRSVVNDHFLGLIENDVIKVKPGISEFAEKKIRFVDGSQTEFDYIIYATGYRFAIPYLHSNLLGVDDPQDLELYQGIMHPTQPRLFVVGVVRALCSIWPLAEQQSIWIAKLLAEEFTAPNSDVVHQEAYPILKVPFAHCQFTADNLRKEANRPAK